MSRRKRSILRRKGFIRILEAVIASLIMLASISFFFTTRTAKTDIALEQIRVEDVLASIQKTGLLRSFVKTNDIPGLNAKLKDLMPQTVDFSIGITGIPNPIIKIACVECSDAQKRDLSNRLSELTFDYKQRKISILIDTLPLNGIKNSEENILFFFGYRNLNAQKPDLQKFLENGTLFMLSNLEANQVEDGVINDLFGLKWNPAGANFHIGEFYDTENPKTVSYRIANYFATISGEDKNSHFMFSLPPNPLKNKVNVDDRTIIKSLVGGPTATSLVKINKEILENGNGRSVWFADYDKSCPPSPAPCTRVEQLNSLLKSAVLWASGEKYKMDPPFKSVPTVESANRYSTFDIVDGFEPFEISLLVWKIFS